MMSHRCLKKASRLQAWRLMSWPPSTTTCRPTAPNLAPRRPQSHVTNTAMEICRRTKLTGILRRWTTSNRLKDWIHICSLASSFRRLGRRGPQEGWPTVSWAAPLPIQLRVRLCGSLESLLHPHCHFWGTGSAYDRRWIMRVRLVKYSASRHLHA
jgi:hypothetical protein